MKKISLFVFTLLFVVGSYLFAPVTAATAMAASAEHPCVRRCRDLHRDEIRVCNDLHGEARARCIHEANERLERCLRNCRN